MLPEEAYFSVQETLTSPNRLIRDGPGFPPQSPMQVSWLANTLSRPFLSTPIKPTGKEIPALLAPPRRTDHRLALLIRPAKIGMKAFGLGRRCHRSAGPKAIDMLIKPRLYPMPHWIENEIDAFPTRVLRRRYKVAIASNQHDLRNLFFECH